MDRLSDMLSNWHRKSGYVSIPVDEELDQRDDGMAPAPLALTEDPAGKLGCRFAAIGLVLLLAALVLLQMTKPSDPLLGHGHSQMVSGCLTQCEDACSYWTVSPIRLPCPMP